MSLSSDVRGQLAGLTSGRVHAIRTPDVPTFPLIIYQRVGGRPIHFSEGAVPDRLNARVQLVVWAKADPEATTIINEARRILVEGPLRAIPLGEVEDDGNEPLKLFGKRQDFSIWYRP